MAIANENPNMVYFLLNNGADVNQRCFGRVFYPDDQKDLIKYNINSDGIILPVKTNYSGYLYLGEYPLSYAAILNQTDCVRLLIANGASVNNQDTNGNTVLHMLIIHDNLVSLNKDESLILLAKLKLKIKLILENVEAVFRF